MRHHAYLDTLDATRLRAIADDDVATLRNILVHAGTFAILTVQTPTDRAEASFGEWVATGSWSDNYLRTARERGVAALRDWAATLQASDFATDGWTFAARVAENVPGLGLAKAAFTAALCGYTETPCMDVHGLRRAVALGIVPNVEVRNTLFRKTRKDAWAQYRAIADATFGSRNAQWDYFVEAEPTFASTGHHVYFAALGLA